jgi:hypothetical protein
VSLEPDNIESLFQPPLPPSSSAAAAAHPLSTASFTSPPASPLRHPRASPPPPALTTRDPNWQSSKCSVRERNAAMFNNSLMADIYFLVGQPSDVKRCAYTYFILKICSSFIFPSLLLAKGITTWLVVYKAGFDPEFAKKSVFHYILTNNMNTLRAS